MSQSSCQGRGGSQAGEAIAFIASMLVLCGLMYYTYTYPYPSGHPPSLGSFAAFWLRELVILLCALVVALIIAIGWVRRVLLGLRGNT
ncbi:hypothetical protein [Roseateles sp.]|uniref:hypothetical protein n=1 Tax=Roseateles sp. TaxID=1971397 RepID=UPI0032675671